MGTAGWAIEGSFESDAAVTGSVATDVLYGGCYKRADYLLFGKLVLLIS